MEAFRLRGIYPDGATSFSEESLFWPKVERGKLPPVNGLVFGDPNGLTKREGSKRRCPSRLRQSECRSLGFDPNAGPISAPSFHPMFHPSRDGSLFVNMVVELVQTVRVSLDGDGSGTFPLRNGATLLISQDPCQDDVRPDPRIRFVIMKQHTSEREERTRNFFFATGRAVSKAIDDDPTLPPDHDDARFQLDFGLLHAGA